MSGVGNKGRFMSKKHPGTRKREAFRGILFCALQETSQVTAIAEATECYNLLI